MIILPMLLSVILSIISLTAWSVIERSEPGLAGFNMDGFIVIGAIFFCPAFCIGYGILALILSFQTISNQTFRDRLVIVSLSFVIFYLFFYILPAFGL